MVLGVIIQRFMRRFSRTFFAWVIVPILLVVVLALAMSWAGQFECWFARAVGYPDQKPPGYRPYHWDVPERRC
jgi:hypothetical protein